MFLRIQTQGGNVFVYRKQQGSIQMRGIKDKEANDKVLPKAPQSPHTSATFLSLTLDMFAVLKANKPFKSLKKI